MTVLGSLGAALQLIVPEAVAAGFEGGRIYSRTVWPVDSSLQTRAQSPPSEKSPTVGKRMFAEVKPISKIAITADFKR